MAVKFLEDVGAKLINATRKEMVNAIFAASGRVVIGETVTFKQSMIDGVSNIELLKSWGCDMVTINHYNVNFPMIPGMESTQAGIEQFGSCFNDAGEPNVNSAEGVEVAEFLADLAPYLPSGYQNFHWDENGQTASGGKAAMTLVATQSTSWLEEESSATAGKWGYLALKSNKGTVGGIIDDYCWSVCVDSQNKEAAGEFVKFFTDTDAQKYFTQKSSTCGATKAYYEDTELQESIPMLSAMSEILNENTNPAPSWGTWAAECEILEVNLQNVMNGNMTAQDALDQVQAKMTEG